MMMFTEQQLDRAEDEVFPCRDLERNSDALRTIYHLASKDKWEQGDKAYMSQFISIDPKSNYGPYLDVLLKDTPSWNAYREWRLEQLHKREIDVAMEEYAWPERWILRPLVGVITYAPAIIAAGVGIYFGIMMTR